MYILAYNNDLTFNGFFIEGVSNNIPGQNIKIDDELFEYLSNLKFKLGSDLDLNKDLYTILDKDLFNIENIDPVGPDKIDLINSTLIKENLQKDIQIKNLNMDLAQTTLNSINKDLEIKDLNMNLAQTTLNLISNDIEVKDLNSNMAHTMLNLVNKDIEVKNLQKDIANLILQTLGGK